MIHNIIQIIEFISTIRAIFNERIICKNNSTKIESLKTVAKMQHIAQLTALLISTFFDSTHCLISSFLLHLKAMG